MIKEKRLLMMIIKRLIMNLNKKDELYHEKEKVRRLTQENSRIKLDLKRANYWTESSMKQNL